MESSVGADQSTDVPIKRDEEKLWTTDANDSVKLRIDTLCPQSPNTVHQMFLESVDKYGALNAISTKSNGMWEHVTFMDYYKLCRQAAKSFLKQEDHHFVWLSCLDELINHKVNQHSIATKLGYFGLEECENDIYRSPAKVY